MITRLLDIKEKNLLGLKIHALSKKELINIAIKRINFRPKDDNIKKPYIIYGFSANIFSRLRKLPELAFFFKEMDIIIADGQGIPILAKIFKVDISERVGIVNLSNDLLELANRNDLRVFILGSTERINMEAINNIKKKYKGIKNCEGLHGYFGSSEELKIVSKISAFKPDILFIGISSPIKERFALKYKDKLNSAVIIPCGGWIDVIADKVKRPPFVLNKIPITWFFRFIQEPRRLFGPIIISMLDTVFCILPVLYFKHITGIERNPSIIKYLKLDSKLKNHSIEQ